MIRNPILAIFDNPQGLDYVFDEINTILTTDLSWLAYSFGKCQRLVKMKNGREHFYPALSVQDNNSKEYLELFPDEHIGNFCFFDVRDNQEYIGSRNQSMIKADFGLVFWCDLRTVYPDDWQTRTVENVKSDVLEVLRKRTFRRSRVKVANVSERIENIYQSYTVSEIKSQFLMRPYCGFRINGMVQFKEKCQS